jgi:hypothetical protein
MKTKIIRIAWRIFQKLFVILLSVLWIVSFIIACHNAMNLSITDASGWWQVVIELLGTPIILYGLYEIWKKVQVFGWKPDIRIGVFNAGALSCINDNKPLSTTVDISQGDTFFQLVVRNDGKAIAKYVKILLEFESVSEDYKQQTQTTIEKLAAPKIVLPKDSLFTRQNNKDFVFTGGDKWFIYPHDKVLFGFHILTTEKDQPPFPFGYRFHCTLWAEGLDNSIIQQLIVNVIRKDPIKETNEE